MMRVLFSIIVTWVLALPPVAAQQTSSGNDHLIVPGERIGPAKLGANVKDIVAVLGQPRTLEGDRGIIPFWWDFARGGIDVVTTSEYQILYVSVRGDPEYATREGLHVGIPEKQVRDVLGEPSGTTAEGKRLSLQYSSGILFSVNYESGTDYQKVTEIQIVSRNCFSNAPPDICKYLTGYR